MGTIFYLIFIFFSDEVTFSWGWFFVSLLFSTERIIYKYTNDRDLDGEEE